MGAVLDAVVRGSGVRCDLSTGIFAAGGASRYVTVVCACVCWRAPARQRTLAPAPGGMARRRGMILSIRRALTLLMACLIVIVGCKSAYYATWEKLGWAKRDILVDRVKDA